MVMNMNGRVHRDKAMSVPVTSEERELLRLAARESNASIAEIMREGSFAEARKRIADARLRQEATASR